MNRTKRERLADVIAGLQEYLDDDSFDISFVDNLTYSSSYTNSFGEKQYADDIFITVTLCVTHK